MPAQGYLLLGAWFGEEDNEKLVSLLENDDANPESDEEIAFLMDSSAESVSAEGVLFDTSKKDFFSRESWGGDDTESVWENGPFELVYNPDEDQLYLQRFVTFGG